MSRLLATLAVVAALASAPAAPVPTHLMTDPPLYFPITVGTTWVYDEDGAVVTRVVTAVEVTGDTWAVAYAVRHPDGTTTPDGKFAVSRTGLTRLEQGATRCDPPVAAVRLPYRVGDEWEFAFALGGLETRGKKVARKPERVTVPAGTFDAVPIETDFAVDGRAMPRATFWYAPGVGMVKRVGGTSTIVLKKFTPGKG